MSQNEQTHESVEEAVFKYVGVGLEKSGDEDNLNKQKSVDWFLKEQDHDDVKDAHRDANDVSAVAAAAVAAALAVKKRDRSGEHGSGTSAPGNQNNKKLKKSKLASFSS